MDKSKQIQKKGNFTAFIIGMILILILILIMMYI
jgi:predicted nucleic acid-binding Zn ribbon protein